jgi:hypothetical protein
VFLKYTSPPLRKFRIPVGAKRFSVGKLGGVVAGAQKIRPGVSPLQAGNSSVQVNLRS